MTTNKIPREEVDYSEIYGNLDLDKQYKFSSSVSAPDVKLKETDDTYDENKKFKKMETCDEEENAINNKKNFKFVEFKDENNTSRYINSLHDLQDIHYCVDYWDKIFLEKIFKTISGDLIELFEIIFDRLEKEWFFFLQNKIKDIKKIEPENTCDICTYNQKEDDPIFVCQGCGLNFHRDCYGTSYSEDEFFLCVSCLYHYKSPTCTFCKQENGIFKLTNDFKFGHLVCVLFNDTLDFDNPNSKEPIDTSKYVELDGLCKFCNNDSGIISCSFGFCMLKYHVPCGLSKCYFDIANNISYCEEHDPRKKSNLFLSVSMSRQFYAGYKKLSNIPSIRRNSPLKARIQTEYMKIISSTPQIPKDIYERIFKIDIKGFLDERECFLEENFNKEVLKSFDSLSTSDFYSLVVSYWILKRKRSNYPGISFLELNFDKLIHPTWINNRKRTL